MGSLIVETPADCSQVLQPGFKDRRRRGFKGKPRSHSSHVKAMSTTIDLFAVCREQFFPRRVGLRSPKTRNQYEFAIRAFAEYLGRPPTLEDLEDDIITVWMSILLNGKLSPWTVREKVGRVLTLWRWCFNRGMVRWSPTVERPPAPDVMPVALRDDQIRALFDATKREDGWIGGVRADRWWAAYLQFVWNSGERLTAVLAVRYDWVDLNRNVVLIPPRVRKGGRKWGCYDLWPRTVQLMKTIDEPRREMFFPWPFSEGTYFYRYGRLLRRAGLPDDRKHKTHCLRATHATHRYLAGHDARRALGHESDETTRRHYFDRSFETPQPPLFDPWDNPPPNGRDAG